MEKKKEKKKVDMVVVLSVIFVTSIICIFNSWLYFDGKIDKMKESNATVKMILKNKIEDLTVKNQELQLSLDKLNADIKEALEGNK